jgi:hypothetical protein
MIYKIHCKDKELIQQELRPKLIKALIKFYFLADKK